MSKSQRRDDYDVRDAARAAGSTRYAGTSCSAGHGPERFVSSGNCVICTTLRDKRTSRDRKPEERARAQRAYLSKPDKRIRHVALVRARKVTMRTAGGKVLAAELRRLLEKQKFRCAYCRISLRKKRTIDHIKPVSRGGDGRLSNLQFLCKPCNSRKNAKDALVFAREIGLLL